MKLLQVPAEVDKKLYEEEYKCHTVEVSFNDLNSWKKVFCVKM